MYDPYTRRRSVGASRSPQVVPRELAVGIARERDALIEALRKERQRNEALIERLEVSESQDSEQSQSSPDAEELLQELRAQQESLRRELEEARARVETLEMDLSHVRTEREDALEERARSDARAQNLMKDFQRLKQKQRHQEDARARRAERDTITTFLEMRDNLARALSSVSTEDEDNPWRDGIVRLLEQFDETLAKHGVVQLGEVGDAFDPAVHEALGTSPEAEVDPGHIAHVARAGFAFQDGELIRPAQVLVAKHTQ